MRWILGAIVLLIVGVVFQLGLLVYAMYVLLGVLLVSRYLARQWIDSVTAERECSRLSAQIGEKVAVVLTLRNTGWLAVPWLIWEDSLPRDALAQKPPRIKTEKRRYGIIRLRAGGEAVRLYQVNFLMRGYYQFGPLMLETGDLFGLHRCYKVLTDPHFILVYPKVLPLTGYDVASRRPIGEVRMTHRLFEDPTRISGVRPYERGDPLSRIHWRATARTGELHCKTYEPSTIAGATILLDFHRDRYTGRTEPHRSELAVTAAASLANAVYQMGQQIGIVTNGRDAADRIREEGHRQDFATRNTARETIGMSEDSDRLRPVTVTTRRGADQLMQLLETLARVELTDGLTFPELVIEAGNRMPRDATVIAILSDVPPETAIALGNLRRRGFAVTAVLVMFDDEAHYPDCMGRLLAERIDVRRIEDEASLSNLCAEQVTG
ncbi:MAG: DUF58 domain-containing protein [Planctomycetaceae bacterium]|jgi:uncharacterized protein (DUF58 family)|nr:DUF58 domain-containing protein [Planctomycetaceae bacterium]MBT6485784.1 DUF58 domain-containing protein [Planctomycetaceae bacterium]MBT6496250.1 DUF58 domain-containing protein [Planctomycetaceae bacterium]